MNTQIESGVQKDEGAIEASTLAAIMLRLPELNAVELRLLGGRVATLQRGMLLESSLTDYFTWQLEDMGLKSVLQLKTSQLTEIADKLSKEIGWRPNLNFFKLFVLSLVGQYPQGISEVEVADIFQSARGLVEEKLVLGNNRPKPVSFDASNVADAFYKLFFNGMLVPDNDQRIRVATVGELAGLQALPKGLSSRVHNSLARAEITHAEPLARLPKSFINKNPFGYIGAVATDSIVSICSLTDENVWFFNAVDRAQKDIVMPARSSKRNS